MLLQERRNLCEVLDALIGSRLLQQDVEQRSRVPRRGGSRGHGLTM